MQPSTTPPANPSATNTLSAEALEDLGHVLVVDDLPANVRLLAGILKLAGYQVSTATSGPEALDKVTNATPDVVLLDVMMPGMDGFEVCRRIKADPDTAFLPVVMVTALQETADRITALEAGADDFLTKPVDEVEVVSRVKSLVRIKRQRDDLEKSYGDLQRVEALRDSLVLMLVHDLRTPLTGILSPLEMLSDGEFGQLDQIQRELISICRRSSYGLLDLVNQLLDISKMESGEMKLDRQLVDIAQVVDTAIERVSTLAQERDTRLDSTGAAGLPLILADKDLLQRTVVNLLGNAIKFTPSASRIEVKSALAATAQDAVVSGQPAQQIIIAIKDNGPGIPIEEQGRIFDKFGQVESRKAGRKTSTGLGLTFCKLAVEAHGGRIWVESEPGQGSTFKFTIPAQQNLTDGT